MIKLLGIICVLVLLLNGPGPVATTNDHKAQVVKDIAGMTKQAQVMVDMVFSFAELGFQEVETSKYLTSVLEGRLQDRTRHCRYSYRVGRDVRFGQTGHRSRLRRRLHSTSFAETRRRLSRSFDRRRTRSR